MNPDTNGSDNTHRLRLPPLRWILTGALAILAGLWLASIVGESLADLDFDGLAHPYLVIFGFVVFDAVIPIFPSESLLNTASTLAAQTGSDIELWRLILAGSLGAVVGDSILYWISRTVLRRTMVTRLEEAKRNEQVAQALDVLSGSAPLLIVAGRFVPGMRFVVSATMGVTGYPYPKFLLWDAAGGVTWASFSCISAYLVASAIDDRPIVSMAVSLVITTALLSVLYRRIKQDWEEQADTAPA
jgi:membrane protein DedA with SNARE-associated domain